MANKSKDRLYRALCDLHSARDKLINHLSEVSKKYYMKDIPLYQIDIIFMLVSHVIVSEDEYKRCYDYVQCLNDPYGICKYHHHD